MEGKDSLNNIIETTKKLITFKSVTGDEKEIDKCFSYIKEHMKDFHISEHYFNGVKSLVISDGHNNEFDVIMLAHIDVVPVESEEEFKSYIERGRLYGRGSGDMKASVAIGMQLMNELKLKKTALMITSDEETGGLNGSEQLAKLYSANFILGLEPSREELVVKNKGKIYATITSIGKSGHGSQPWLGDNSVEKLFKVFSEVKKQFSNIKNSDGFDEKWSRTLNLGMIRAGSNAYNIIPGKAEMGLDIRFNEKYSEKEIIEFLERICDKNNCKLDISSQPAAKTSKSNSYVKKLKKITGSEFGVEYGGSDTRAFNKRGIPTIDYGPIEKNIHDSGEHVFIDSVERVYNNLKEFFNQ